MGGYHYYIALRANQGNLPCINSTMQIDYKIGGIFS